MFNPGFQLPGRVGTDVAEQNLQAPPILRTEIKASDKWFQANGRTASDVAERIVAARAGQIHQFWQAQQQNYNAGVVKIVSRALSLPQLTIRYDAIQGTQILTLTVYPENPSTPQPLSQIDLNMDGFIAWTMTTGTGSASVGYQFQVNGQSIYSYSMPPSQNVTIVFLFGKTALKCQSLIDKSETNPQLPGNPNQPLFPAVLPSRAPVKAFTNEFGVGIAERADLPGYFLYDPSLELFNGGRFISQNAYDIIQTIVVPVQGSPLNDKGLNTFRVKLNPSVAFGVKNGWGGGYDMYAEFYDRFEVRVVDQSWRLKGGNITVNDKPLFFRMASGAYPEQAMDIDFGKKTIDTTQRTGINPGTAFTPAQATGQPASLTQWSDQTAANGMSQGYWRPGDPQPAQPTPPNSPWQFAVDAALQAILAWNNLVYLMSLSYENVGAVVQSTPTDQIPVTIYTKVKDLTALEGTGGLSTFSAFQLTMDTADLLVPVCDVPDVSAGVHDQKTEITGLDTADGQDAYILTNSYVDYSNGSPSEVYATVQQIIPLQLAAKQRYLDAVAKRDSTDIFLADEAVAGSIAISKSDVGTAESYSSQFMYGYISTSVYSIQRWQNTAYGSVVIEGIALAAYYAGPYTMSQITGDPNPIVEQFGVIPTLLNAIANSAAAPTEPLSATNKFPAYPGQVGVAQPPSVSYVSGFAPWQTGIWCYEQIEATVEQLDTLEKTANDLLSAMNTYKTP